MALSRRGHWVSPALVSEYQTRLPDKQLLQAKLHEFYELAQERAALPVPILEQQRPAKPRKAERNDGTEGAGPRDTSGLTATTLSRIQARFGPRESCTKLQETRQVLWKICDRNRRIGKV